MRGGERVLEELADLFPDADLHTLVHVPGATSARIERLRIRASPLSRLPGAARHYRKLLPLYPWAIQRFHLEGYDLVVSTSHAVARGVRIAPGTPHLSYCFTPMRYVWDQADAYLGRGLRRALAAPLVAYLRRFDRHTSRADHVHHFVACSRNVADRIRRHYRRIAAVVYPPVAVDRIRPSGGPPDDFYLMVAGFVPYKREAVAIEAFRTLGRRLVVAGDGPLRARLAARAPANVELPGRIGDEALADLYARCRALVFPADEDFGIVPVEAQAAGRPVIAWARGGALETVRAPGTPEAPATGILFEGEGPAPLAAAVRRFEEVESEFDAGAIRAHAEGFGAERFRREIRREIEATVRLARGEA